MSTWPASLEKLRGTVGVWTFAHESIAADRSGDIAAELESLGYAALWLPEAWGREAFTNAALMLGATSSMIVATGIANIWARDAVAANNAAKTLNAAYEDRFVLGLGVSHRPLVERLRGHEYETPVAAMRDYLTAMDAAPMMAPEGQLRYARVIAALGPKMLEIGATLADGVHPYLVTPEHTARARAAVGDKFVGVEQAVVLGQSREEYLNARARSSRVLHRPGELHATVGVGWDSPRRTSFAAAPIDSVTPWSSTVTRRPCWTASTNTARPAPITSVCKCSVTRPTLPRSRSGAV